MSSWLRRPWVLVTAALVPVLALVLTFVLTHHQSRNDALVEAPSTATPTADPTLAPSPSDSPTASATPSTAKPNVADSPTSTPTHKSDGGGDGLGPHPPGSVTVAHYSGQHSWSGTSSGIHLSMSISPTTPHAGSPVTFTVHVSGPENNCCAVYIVFGDGGTSSSGIDCPLPATGGSATATYTHTYNKSGPHHFLLQGIAGTNGQCEDNGELYGTIDIGSGTSTAQGPDLPVVKFSQSTPPANDPYYQKVSLWGQADDDDGHITKLVVTFGDGTSKTFAGDPMACQKTTDGWPGPSEASLPYDPKPYEHAYTHSGTYTLTLTAYSAGCNGGDVQKATASFQFTAQPGPNETPSPTPSPTPTTG